MRLWLIWILNCIASQVLVGSEASPEVVTEDGSPPKVTCGTGSVLFEVVRNLKNMALGAGEMLSG